jgi:hypothetical protein
VNGYEFSVVVKGEGGKILFRMEGKSVRVKAPKE